MKKQKLPVVFRLSKEYNAGMSLSSHIFKVGAWTGFSRVLGLARDLLIARVLGAGRLSDIFFAAFRLPNLFRDLLGEGALSLVFVPMFAKHKNRSKIGPFFASNIFSWLMAILLIITVIAQIAMPLIMWAIVPGFADDPEKMQMTVFVSRILFSYVILVCGIAFLSGVLNAFSDFARAAAMPAVLNMFMIGGLVLAMYLNAGEGAIYILSGAVLLSGVVQLGILWHRLIKRKFGLRIIRPRFTPGVKTMVRRIGLGFAGNGFYQLNILAGTLIASFQTGAISWLYYADRMVQLPFAVIGLAAGTVLLTSISDALNTKDFEKIYNQQNRVLRNTMMFTLPSMIGLFVLAQPIIQFLFEHGAWTSQATVAVAMAIMIQTFALPAMTTSQVFSRTLYAAQDVKTPVKISIVALIVGIAVMFALAGFIGYLAVPVGTVVSGYLRNAWLRYECRSRGLYRPSRSANFAIFIFGILSLAMGAGLWWAMSAELITGIFTLMLAIAAAAVVYLPVAWAINKKIT